MPIRMDASAAYSTVGFLETVSERIGTPQYIGPVLRWVHGRMSDEFTTHMSAVSQANPYSFHHVYEWDEIGNPKEQLWRDVLVGGGNNRVATFEWLASKKIVPVVHEDAIGHVKEIHVFTWKAPVMEYNEDITISPKRGQYLVYFTGPPGPHTDEELHIVKGRSITVRFPGGEAAHGAFTREYVSWWAGEGSALFRSEIRHLLEVDLKNMPLRSTRGNFIAGARSVQKDIGIQVLANAEAAKAAGSAKANAWLQARARNYIEQARAREMIGYGE